MPISYQIDSERKLVHTRASGVLTDDELLRHKRALLSDPRFEAGFRELSDTRSVAELRVTPDGVRNMVALDAEHSDRLQSYRLAIVAPRDAVFGTARMYELLTERHLAHVRVFRDSGEATSWLES